MSRDKSKGTQQFPSNNMSTEADIKSVTFRLISTAFPELGFLTTFIGILWPNEPEDPWDKIKDRTEKLINDRLDQDAFQRLKQRLAGIKDVLTDYNQIMSEEIDASKKYNQFQITDEKFVGEIPSFQEGTHARTLLPLFMQCANLHLLFLNHAYKIDPKVMGFQEGDR